MEKQKIQRINELTKLSRIRELSDEEKTERAGLRAEYIGEIKNSARAALESVYIQDDDGTEQKLKKK